MGLFAIVSIQTLEAEEATATFAGGCFWCVESDFDHVSGVMRTTAGYTDGSSETPTYEAIGAGGAGSAIETIPAKLGQVNRANCDRNKAGNAIFFRRGIPSGLSHQKPHTL